MNEEAEFEYDWLIRQKYEFKILTLIAVLADNNLAYRGTLKEMCEFFGVASGDSRNNRNIKDAIDKLEQDGLLKQIKDGRTYTLTLSKKGEKRKQVIRIQKEWVEIAKRHKSTDPARSTDWVNLLKVWLFLIDNKKETLYIHEIATALGISTSTVKRAKSILEHELKAIDSKPVIVKKSDGIYFCLGSSIQALAWIEETPSAPL